MLTKHYQALIRQTREQLADLYNLKTETKRAKRDYDATGLVKLEYECHNELKKLSKQIATLVEVQQALKATVRKHVITQRDARWYKKAAAERRDSLRESVLKRAAMDSAGEV